MTRIPSPLRTLAWSIYLGMSWTWCVGMFVTVALYREFGFAAWVAVTIPNVIGAASVGFTFARPGARSDAVVARHRQAVVGFSAITLAFHAFFLFWLARAGLIPTVAAAAVAIGLAIGLVNRRDIRVDLLLGVAVLAVSAVVLIHGLAHVGRAVLAPPDPPRTPTAMAALAVACVFGFLTCPYLDVTFHRACQSLPPNPKRVAFAVGLGVVFLSMIAGTTLYAGDFNRGFTGAFTLAGLTTWVAAHLCVQTGYKWAVHLRALPPWRPTDALIWAFALTTAALSAVGLIAHVTLGFHAYDDLILPGQVYYRIFTSFYGLLFPAYVWLCMVPLPGRPAPGPTKQSLTVLAVAVVIATPMYWLGFLADQWAWIPVGVAILLAARLFVRSAETSATDERR